MDNKDFNEELNKRAEYCGEVVKRFLPEKEGYASRVCEAMEYSVLAGGKRLRPVLMLETYNLFCREEDSASLEALEHFMAAIEMIHTYSLVHDDLPAMDNDEYRRGKLTTWKRYGEGMGVLAGDGLLNLAFETIAGALNKAYNPLKIELTGRCIRAAGILSEKAGYLGMIGGQCADLEAEGRETPADIDELLYIHEHKTACLIEAALMVGGILGGAGADEIEKLERIGSNVGLAFQIRDDILDVTGNSKELGKNVGSDAANGKATYVSINGLEASDKEVQRLSEEAEKLLETFPGEKGFIRDLIASLIRRTK